MEASAKTLPRMHNASQNDFQPVNKHRKDEIRSKIHPGCFCSAEYLKGDSLTCNRMFSLIKRPILCF